MSVIRDIWANEATEEPTRTTYHYMLELREHLEETCKLAHDELRKAQSKQHKWFYRKAKVKNLKVDDQVLLLLPTRMNKLELEMQRQGLYVIIKKAREYDYVSGLGGQSRMFHANVLRKYTTRKPV